MWLTPKKVNNPNTEQHLPQSCNSTHDQTVAGQCSRFVEAANLHFPCKRYPEGLCAENIWTGEDRAHSNESIQ